MSKYVLFALQHHKKIIRSDHIFITKKNEEKNTPMMNKTGQFNKMIEHCMDRLDKLLLILILLLFFLSYTMMMVSSCLAFSVVVLRRRKRKKH
jgi:hypothetical protein